ncbi:MAG: ankyrin repeat domain-containing protein [bacterium]|nr:ankyrin repeat domain-containing protein [bacterium]
MAKNTFNQKSPDPAAAEKLGQELLKEIQGDADLAHIKKLIAMGANIEARDDKGNTPVLAAAYRAQNNVVKELLVAGANPDAENKSGGFALMLAAMMGPPENPDLAQMLIDHKAQVDKPYKTLTPLMWAAQRGFKDVARIIGEHADIMLKSTGSTQQNAIEWAENNRKMGVVAILKNLQEGKEILKAEEAKLAAEKVAQAAAEQKRETFEEAIEGMHTDRAIAAPKVAKFKKRTPVPQK